MVAVGVVNAKHFASRVTFTSAQVTDLRAGHPVTTATADGAVTVHPSLRVSYAVGVEYCVTDEGATSYAAPCTGYVALLMVPLVAALPEIIYLSPQRRRPAGRRLWMATHRR